MINKKFEVYFDFGSSKIRASAFNINNEVDCFNYESNNFFDHTDIDKNIENIILNIEKKTEEYLETINLMVDSLEMLSISMSLSKNFDGSELKREDIQFLIKDAKQQISRSYPNQNIIHLIVRNYKINDIDYSFFPEGINCNLLSIEIFFICLPKKIIEYFKKIFFRFDISINKFFCSSYTKSINYKNNFPSINNISFIDIGFDRTSIISYNKDKINNYHTLPIGGNNITKDISKVLNIDLINAERIKLNLEEDEKFLIEKKLSDDLIQKIILTRIEEILELSIKLIKLNQNLEDSSQSQIFLIGGGSRVLDKRFKNKISIKDNIKIWEETSQGICLTALKLNEGINKQEVAIIPKKQINKGFFEKLFHFFN